MFKKKSAGFSIVELMVVIAVLIIIAGIAVSRFIQAAEVARGSRILTDMNSCESAVNIYYAKNGNYPADEETIVAFYLADWPKPPVGKALVKKHDNNDLILDVLATIYVYNRPANGSELTTRTGRITLGGKTIEDILTTSETSLTLIDK